MINDSTKRRKKQDGCLGGCDFMYRKQHFRILIVVSHCSSVEYGSASCICLMFVFRKALILEFWMGYWMGYWMKP